MRPAAGWQASVRSVCLTGGLTSRVIEMLAPVVRSSFLPSRSRAPRNTPFTRVRCGRRLSPAGQVLALLLAGTQCLLWVVLPAVLCDDESCLPGFELSALPSVVYQPSPDHLGSGPLIASVDARFSGPRTRSSTRGRAPPFA
jgi:hypothetical protein